MKYCPICDRSYGEEATVCDVDGATLHEAAGGAENLVGKTIRGRYNVLKKIGEGGMAVVYLAEQVNIGRSVALKVLHGQYARDPEFVKRFRQEAKLAASLSHPHVVQIYDFDQAEDGTLFFAMEYLAGRSLRALMQQGQLGLEKGVSLGVQMAEGFGVAHRAGVIHRDIKPENVMVIADDDRIKLMDFGIARLREAGPGTRLTRTGIVMGTPMYMAPEQIQGGEVTEKTDIYSLGIVLYEMFTGVAPFKAPTPAAVLMKQLKEAPVPLRKLRADVPASVQSIVARALEKEPSRRPATMGEIADALRKEQVKPSPRPSAQTLVTTQELE
ncbi:MAG TPA: serine/threonine-protein kinase, partial [Candidatus Saccharimonadales bacterium]|nr:serine/threonine-protein kinase [Candidatus Saccharimonadales bacterium]